MKDFKELIIHKFNKDIIVCPISDVHFGSIGHREKEWNEFCKFVEKNENVYMSKDLNIGEIYLNHKRKWRKKRLYKSERWKGEEFIQSESGIYHENLLESAKEFHYFRNSTN